MPVQLRHSIENIAPDLRFCPLIGQTPGIKPPTNDGFAPIYCRLNQLQRLYPDRERIGRAGQSRLVLACHLVQIGQWHRRIAASCPAFAEYYDCSAISLCRNPHVTQCRQFRSYASQPPQAMALWQDLLPPR
jgi:hypothetical protein